MAEKIDRQEVQHVADLAKLSFDDEALDKITPQLEEIIGLFTDLQKVDTDGVEPMYSPTTEVNVMREDKGVRSNQRDALLKNAPDTQDGLIKVPAIIDESEDGDK
ncbi:MAG TPA: Asp-tRNA(Asn)/Glu-tRNA(Gln) amidotransferase subunit GatC [Candidatus Limosilactobacillus merdigallinarum]|uniref:Aspartyl/glutamyl-tRNA(Asn/Gln) amidotransferase subunit C n=1 Tax=Candidatus Limosilactobacillus merdigallinarum TaxID=2838652 RepID=A0A9D2AJM4_9LACO|nr:Asp-tRNA(Asn)/Glu-tRNA(Gln) amidotransferase subunit GatC [Candidatus Limosilactobacillus merdigallinarum]